MRKIFLSIFLLIVFAGITIPVGFSRAAEEPPKKVNRNHPNVSQTDKNRLTQIADRADASIETARIKLSETENLYKEGKIYDENSKTNRTYEASLSDLDLKNISVFDRDRYKATQVYKTLNPLSGWTGISEFLAQEKILAGMKAAKSNAEAEYTDIVGRSYNDPPSEEDIKSMERKVGYLENWSGVVEYGAEHQRDLEKFKDKVAEVSVNNNRNAVNSSANLTDGQISEKCWDKGLNLPGCFRMIIALIGYFVLSLTALVLGISGFLLDEVLRFTVFEMAKNVSTNQVAINEAWAFVRDFVNLGFIFVLLYAAIMTILRGDDSNIKRVIINLVIAALLINFSLFFTKVVIDASNIVTTGLYQSATAGGSLSNQFMEPLRLTSLYDTTKGALFGEGAAGVFQGQPYWNVALISILGSFFFIITAFIFFAASIMFIVRYVVLVILMILSPLMFLGMVLPGTKQRASQWINSLTGQAIFAPVFMLLVILTLKVVKIRDLIGSASFQDLVKSGTTPQPGAFTLVMNFIMIMVFLTAALIISKSFATQGAGVIGKAIGTGQKYLGNTVFGGSGWLARQTVGRGANALAQSEKFKDYASRSVLGKYALKGTQKVAGSSLDLRNAPGTGIAGEMSGTDFGKAGGKGGYVKTLKDKVKKEEEFARSLAPSDVTVARADQAIEEAKVPQKALEARIESEIEKEMKGDVRKDYFDLTKRDLEEAKAEERKQVTVIKDKETRQMDSKITTQERQAIYDSLVDDREKLERFRNEKLAVAEQAHRVSTQDYTQMQEEAKAHINAKYATEVRQTKERTDDAVKEAQTYKDTLVGVDEKEAQKRLKRTGRENQIRSEVERDANILPENKKAEVVRKIEAEVKNIKVEGQASRRQKGLAENIEREQINRLFGGKHERAAAVRKLSKGKKAEDKLKEVVKEMSDADKDSETEPETGAGTAGGGAPAAGGGGTPAAGGGAPTV